MNTDSHYLRIAEAVANEGRCKRRQIGAVLVDSAGTILANGMNGPPVTMRSCFESPCPGADVPAGQGAGKTVACYGVHAEIDALLKCSDISKVHTLYCTKAPCTSCVLTLLNTKCKRIVFLTPSNETTNKELWEASGRVWG